MNILSYRGPSCPGGVSGTIARLIERHSNEREFWWYLSQNRLTAAQHNVFSHHCSIPENIIDGHYRYCNDFLWPIMHDMPERARYSALDRFFYKQLNLSFATNVLRHSELSLSPTYFIQDYQLAEVPLVLSRRCYDGTKFFWHIPWPKYVPECYVGYVTEIAEGLLNSALVGFHAEEYVENFLRFTATYLPDYLVDFQSKTVSKTVGSSRPIVTCKIIAQPLGIDLDFWKQESERWSDQARRDLVRSIVRGRYVLSVDRADYAKGVKERFQAIDQFFTLYPQFRQNVTFVQVCQRSREGLIAFDRYWQDCTTLAEQVNCRWRTDTWQPIIWLTEQISPAMLAALYGRAAAMLVNPLRDGLNLTAKEFAVCAGRASGVLLLSSTAGAWHELGQFAMHVSPSNSRLMAQSIRYALSIPAQERQRRLAKLREVVEANTLSVWWQRFGGKLSTGALRNPTSEILRARTKVDKQAAPLSAVV